MAPYIRRLRRLGIEARAVRLPRGAAERAVGALLKQVGPDLGSAVIGGHSFGGRVASLLAAEAHPAGLVLLSYPLHRPGHPEELRIEHWPMIECPVLVLSGDRDQFARVDLLERSVGLLEGAELHVYPGARHGLTERADDVAERIARFTKRLGPPGTAALNGWGLGPVPDTLAGATALPAPARAGGPAAAAGPPALVVLLTRLS
jgi:predicted alpha/beta-hydrolase family hydrolase